MSALTQLIDLLKLEKIDDLLFRGKSQDLGFRQVFGGQVVAQALSAVIQVAPEDRILHSCHAYFLSPGDSQYPIIYDVEILREGRNFTAMRVKAIQHKSPICHITASFQTQEHGFEHQSDMPQVEGPDELMSESSVIQQMAQMIPEAVRDKFTADRPFDTTIFMGSHRWRSADGLPHSTMPACLFLRFSLYFDRTSSTRKRLFTKRHESCHH